MLPREDFFDFYSLSPLSQWVSASFRRYIDQFNSPWVKPCESADYLISTWNFLKITNIFIMTNLTDFHKKVETGVGPHLHRIQTVKFKLVSVNEVARSILKKTLYTQ